MIVAGTGHRPEKSEPEDVVRGRIRRVLQDQRAAIDCVITGCASGFDLWLGDEAIELGVPVVAARPWATHAPRRNDVALYAKVIENASKVVILNDSRAYPGARVYFVRNEWMVDNASHVLAYWDGEHGGGTASCIDYARKTGKPIRNIYGKDI